MEPTSRRKFLRNTSVAVAAAGVAATVPLTAAQALGDTHDQFPTTNRSTSRSSRTYAMSARARSSLYTGEREIIVKDKRLASLLYHASR